ATGAAPQVFFKGTSSTEVDGVSTSGVDFWHAVEFSRNGRFLRTHRSNCLLGLSSGLSFFVSDSIRSFRA
ncbi:hypothetical protein, partial [Streptomyces sp. WAC05292]|uniref:hypothetical protein n=1 Tax=Streptomyces sp. WAC05292 TaxID=2487418 RepID=UPI001C8E25EA